MLENGWQEKIKPSHHAYLIAGTKEEALFELIDFLQKEWKVKTAGNPDFYVEHFPSLLIENCHDIENRALKKAFGDGPKIFVISFGTMTRESANALLKLFEEPTGTIFFIITPHAERLPPTLLSRCYVVSRTRRSTETVLEEAEKFIKMSVGNRFEFSKKFSFLISDEKRTRSEAMLFLEAVLELCHEKSDWSHGAVSEFRELEKCRSYLKDQSSSVKIILDEAALAVEEIANLRAVKL